MEALIICIDKCIDFNVLVILIPGVMQLESNLFSVGRTSPDSLAFFSKASASRADLLQNTNIIDWMSMITRNAYKTYMPPPPPPRPHGSIDQPAGAK